MTRKKTVSRRAGWLDVATEKLTEQIEGTYPLWCKLAVTYVQAPPFKLMAEAAVSVFEASVKEREANFHLKKKDC